jgi:perosamine synthetase
MRINIAKPDIGEEEISEVSRVMRSGMIASGPETKLFEEEFAKFVGSKYACAVNNGTSALSVALSAAGIGHGDEVITTPLTFVATANAILSCGAIPVFADINENTFNLSAASVKKMINEKTRAIMPVHLYGLAAEMDQFRDIADEFGIVIIGDAAQAHGAEINDKIVGTLADLECFSFYPTKNMTTGEGGMVTTNDEQLFKLIKSISNHGRPTNTLGTYEYERFGLNLRLTDIGSAIGRVQLKKLKSLNERRKKNAELMSKLLYGINGIKLPEVPLGYVHCWHQYTIRVKNRLDLVKYLKDRGIGTGIYYPRLIYDYPHLEKFMNDCPVAKSLVNEVVSIPIHPGLDKVDIIEIAETIKKWSLGISR